MADSIRNQILDAVIAALGAITAGATYNRTVNYVSEDLVHWEKLDKNKFDAAFPLDLSETDEQFALYSTATNDIKATLEIMVTYYIWSGVATTRQARGDAVRDVKKALLNDATILGLVLDIRPMGTEPVVITDHYSVLEIRFEADYLYDHTAGG
uniref:Tail protein n=1 Tax=viral metagenome TaxID=1070528 RepID=A0A6M3L3L7_9ZZZZ